MSEKHTAGDEARCKVTIEHTASDKFPRKLAVTDEADAELVSSVIDDAMEGFLYLENRVARDVMGEDVPPRSPATPAPKPTAPHEL